MLKDYEKLRENMVRTQIMARGVADERTLAAMTRVPREEFVPPHLRSSAYADAPMSIGHGQTISQPYMVALMTSLLALKGQEKVLEIGTGSGYQTAILAEIAAQVFSIDRMPELADMARPRLEKLGYGNIRIRIGDGTLGWEEEAPFDGIIVTAGAPSVPEALMEQLAIDGRLVIPVGRDRYLQHLKVITRTQRGFETHNDIACVFVPLIGEQGWKEGQV